MSIADLGGTEIDLRFASSAQGKAFVVVAPVLRFADGERHWRQVGMPARRQGCTCRGTAGGMTRYNSSGKEGGCTGCEAVCTWMQE